MSEFSLEETIKVAPYMRSESWLIGASTHATDRFVADVERIFEPAREHVGGEIHFNLTRSPVSIPAIRRKSRKLRIKNLIMPPKPVDLGNRIAFDVRQNDYFNWSHQVNFFLTLALAARSRADSDITIILPSGMPKTAFELYSHFRFRVVSTDGAVTARKFGWMVPNTQIVTSGRPQLIAPFMSAHDKDVRIFPAFDLPKRVFLARRGTRALSNESEIESLLAGRGFEKVYTEDLSVPQQFALLRQAEDVVAIHGAGLAPLEYRSPSKPGMRLIELAPAGIVTRWFGIMCEQVGGTYIAVRGRLKPEYIQGLYGDELFEKYCNDDFEIDPRSLEVALEMIGSPS